MCLSSHIANFIVSYLSPSIGPINVNFADIVTHSRTVAIFIIRDYNDSLLRVEDKLLLSMSMPYVELWGILLGLYVAIL